MPDTTVKFFDSTQSGAPTLSGQAGRLVAVLDACLINGYGSVTLDSLVVSGNVATATQSTGHGFTMLGTSGPVVTISGAATAGINGEWRIASVPDSTTFTFAAPGVSNQTASGTIAVKRSAAGWGKAFAGTNKGAYRSADVTGTRRYFRVNDASATIPSLNMYATMTTVDAGTGGSPTYYFGKSSEASAVARPWRLVADGRRFYLFAQNDGAEWYGMLFFGDVGAYKSADAYACLLIAGNAADYYSNNFYLLKTNNGHFCRGYNQAKANVAAQLVSHGHSNGLGAGAMQAYPAPADTAFHGWPVEAWEDTAVARGLMPGLWNPIHAAASIADGTIISAVSQIGGGSLIVQQLAYGSFCALALAGPW